MKTQYLADISLFQSLEQGNYPAAEYRFPKKADVSVHNVDIALGALASVSRDSSLNELVGLLKKLGTLNLAEKALSTFRANSVREVVNALVFGLGGDQVVRSLLGTSGQTDTTEPGKPKVDPTKVSVSSAQPSVDDSPSVSSAQPSVDASPSISSATPVSDPDSSATVPETTAVVAKPASKREIKKEYKEARTGYDKLRKLYAKNPNSTTLKRDLDAASDRYEKAIEAYNKL